MCHRVNVMYAGRIVEEAGVDELFAVPRHPYTLGLLESIPRLDSDRHEPLSPIPGQPPDLAHLPMGCSFRPRCRWAQYECELKSPRLFEAPVAGRFACFVDITRTDPGEKIHGSR